MSLRDVGYSKSVARARDDLSGALYVKGKPV